MNANPRRFFPALPDILSSGGDARIIPDKTGANKYGCFPAPHPEILSYASSTASTISETGYTACLRLYERLIKTPATGDSFIYACEMDRMRKDLMELYGLGSYQGLDIIWGCSGTDMHLLATQLVCENSSRLLVVMPEASETGSGVPAAVNGRHFSVQTPEGGRVVQGELIAGSKDVETAVMTVRLADGSAKPLPLVDAEVEIWTETTVADGKSVLINLIDVSKTGLIAPSPACALALKQRFPGKVNILVDACQARLSGKTLRAYLEKDCLVAISGSKFVTGPAFSAALFVPPPLSMAMCGKKLPHGLQAYSVSADWPSTWAMRSVFPERANYGLLLRWTAALAEKRAFCMFPEDKIRAFLEVFAKAVDQKLAGNRVFEPFACQKISRQPLVSEAAWDHIPTIFPFLMRHPKTKLLMTREETILLYELMKKDLSASRDLPGEEKEIASLQCHLGQPVLCGVREGVPVSALRLCLDMRLIAEALSTGGGNGHRVIANAMRVLDKALWLAGCRMADFQG